MSSSNSTVNLDTFDLTLTHDSEQVALNKNCTSNKANGSHLLSIEENLREQG